MVVMDICKFLQGLKPVLMMVIVQAILAGITVFYKLATIDGMNMKILVAYRYMFATIFLLPFAFFIERNKRPKLTWKIAFQIFLCGLFGGTLSQNLYASSLNLTSMTFAAAMTNLIPATTFLVALVLRMEKLRIETMAGKAKIMGTTISIGGAMILTFYRGPKIKVWSTEIDLSHGASTSARHAGNNVLGSILAFGCCLCYAIWLNVQTKMSEKYPCHLTSTALMCLMGSVQSTVFAMCENNKWEEWKLGWNIRLLSVAYSNLRFIGLAFASYDYILKGILASGVSFTLIAWTSRARGPLFISIFNPLMLLMVAIVGYLFLAEDLHVGMLIGAALIVIGLYAVLWGKQKEMKMMSQLTPTENFNDSKCVEVLVTSNPPSALTSIDNNGNNTDLSSTACHNLALANLATKQQQKQ